MIPVFINVRDRVRDLRELVAWLERAGHERITLLDNDSTWEPCRDYLDASPHRVIHLGRNAGPYAIWSTGLVPDEPYVYTDPDVVPTGDCPLDAVAYLAELLARFPEYRKAGLGLYLDDVPDDMPSLDWERDLAGGWREIAPGVLDSFVDTTFALYAAGAPSRPMAIRTAAPYQARHGSWYVTEPNDEDSHYLEHAVTGSEGSSWKEWVAWR